MSVSAAAVSGVLGLIVGLWMPAIINRTPMRQGLLRPRPHCMVCGTATVGAPWPPILAKAVGYRSCEVCENKLWPGTPWIEISTAIFLGLCGGRLGWFWATPAYLVLFAALFAITIVDLRHYLIPNMVVYPALFTCLGLLVIAAIAGEDGQRLVWALTGMACSWLFFFVIWFCYPKGMGFGDVRLSALIGLLAGWMGLPTSVLSILVGLVLGAVVGVLAVILRIRSRKQAIPFGPFLASGAVLTMLFGVTIQNLFNGNV